MNPLTCLNQKHSKSCKRVLKSKNKNFQISVIKRMIKSRGIDPSLVDVEAEVDSTLTLEENARIMKNKIKNEKIVPETKSVSKIERYLEAQKIFGKHKNKSQIADFSKNASHRFEMNQLSSSNYKKWLKQPNRYDIVGID
jgi:hypothetical protein